MQSMRIQAAGVRTIESRADEVLDFHLSGENSSLASKKPARVKPPKLLYVADGPVGTQICYIYIYIYTYIMYVCLYCVCFCCLYYFVHLMFMGRKSCDANRE